MSHTVKIKNIRSVTHDVKQFTCEKPEGYEFVPGQATRLSIDKEGWRDEKRPFTFTSLNEDPELEFVIKIYDDHDGVTKQIDQLEEGDRFIIREPFGTIQYTGPGVFLAGGAGVTPFIAILRDLDKKGELEGNTLLFSNKTERDIILREEFEEMLGDRFINVITREETDRYISGHIDEKLLSSQLDDFDQAFYLCGPIDFVMDLSNALTGLGAVFDDIILEE